MAAPVESRVAPVELLVEWACSPAAQVWFAADLVAAGRDDCRDERALSVVDPAVAVRGESLAEWALFEAARGEFLVDRVLLRAGWAGWAVSVGDC